MRYIRKQTGHIDPEHPGNQEDDPTAPSATEPTTTTASTTPDAAEDTAPGMGEATETTMADAAIAAISPETMMVLGDVAVAALDIPDAAAALELAETAMVRLEAAAPAHDASRAIPFTVVNAVYSACYGSDIPRPFLIRTAHVSGVRIIMGDTGAVDSPPYFVAIFDDSAMLSRSNYYDHDEAAIDYRNSVKRWGENPPAARAIAERYPDILASAICANNNRVELHRRRSDCLGPKFAVRVDNGRDVVEKTDYYTESDAWTAFRAEMLTQDRSAPAGDWFDFDWGV